MQHSPLKGVIAASLTPVTADFSVDITRLKAHIDTLLDQGCSHVSTFGTTGEGASLSTAQKVAALTSLKALGADMGRQVPAVMTPVLEEAVNSVIAYGELGCRAVLVLPPFYYGATEEGIAGFYDALIEKTAGRTAIDLLLYNIPQLSRVPFTPSLINRLLSAHGKRIVGIKDSTGDLENGLMLVKSFPDLAVFTGDDRVLPVLVESGGAGMIGGMPNLFARDLVSLYENNRDAATLEKQTRRILAVDRFGSLVALKAALAHYAGDEALARPLPPLAAVVGEARAALLQIFDETGFRAAA